VTGGVFISYSRADEAYVTRLADHLRELGIVVWVDHAIRRGDRFIEVIEEQIAACAALVAVLTPTAVASRWCRREVSYADMLDKPILPLLLAQCRLTMILHDLDHEDVTTGAMPSARFVESLRRRIDSPSVGPIRPADTPHCVSWWYGSRKSPARTATGTYSQPWLVWHHEPTTLSY
jgi:hypothetical protein